MHFKTFCVLSVACSFLSSSLYAFEYENASNTEGYESSSAGYSEAVNDPVFDEGNTSYAYNDNYYHGRRSVEREFRSPRVVSGHPNYAARLPKNIPAPGEKLIIVNPHKHVWGAYTESGKLIRAGIATAGAKWCSDIGRSCRTKVGVFRINSLGDSDCVSKIYPVGEGGAPMPYCMFFNGGQGLHGSNHLAEGNLSHGCVRISVNDAEWVRYNFARRGTKVIIQPY